MFTIKICGITCVADAMAAAEAGADAIGLNFYAASPRFLQPDRAREIAGALPASVAKVGLFVNATLDTIVEHHRRLELDYVQLHGDEPAVFARQLLDRIPMVRIIRAVRMPEGHWQPVEAYLRACREEQVELAGVLMDAFRPGQYGGTGATLPWQQLRERPPAVGALPLVLAGGLNPENVAEAIRQARPQAVDTASGVEAAPGVKSPRLMQAFVTRAREAFRTQEAGLGSSHG